MRDCVSLVLPKTCESHWPQCTVHLTDLGVQHTLQLLHAPPPARLVITRLHPDTDMGHTHIIIMVTIMVTIKVTIMVTIKVSSPQVDHAAAVGHLAVQLPAVNARVTHLRELRSKDLSSCSECFVSV